MDYRICVAALVALITATVLPAHELPAPPRTVSVSGEGEASVKPDRARLTLAVEKLDPDLKKAESEVNRIVREYLSEAKALGAKDEQLSTSGVSIHPEYVWPEGGRERKFTGYRVSRQIEIRVENLDRLGDFILRATRAGVNQVNPPELESSKRSELERQALVKAAQDARARAQALAETLGVRLGAAYRITEARAGIAPVPQMKAMRAEAADAGSEMGLSLGEIRYRTSVSAEFDLLPP